MRSSDNLRLDVSVFKKGFETNKFALLYKSKQTRIMDQKLFPKRQMANALNLTAMDVSQVEANQNVLYKLEGLEPGLTYFWRVLRENKDTWETSEVIRITAPTCPLDNYLEPK